MPVRALAIEGKEKLIGSRDGLFYIDEENHRYKSFKVPQLRSNMIFSCLYYQNEYYIGTYGGGMYVLNPATLTLRDFEPDGGMPFSKGHIFCIKQDREKNLWIGTSLGIFTSSIRASNGMFLVSLLASQRARASTLCCSTSKRADWTSRARLPSWDASR